MSPQAHLGKQAEIVAVTNFLTPLLGKGLQLPVEWKPIAARIRHELEKLGEFELAKDVRADGDGITLRWTRLESKEVPGQGHTFVLDQFLWQKAREEA